MPALPEAALLGSQAGVGADLDGAHLALQLGIAGPSTSIQLAGGQRDGHRAAGLASVAAVGEPASRQKSLDVAEGLLQSLRAGPELDLAQPRRVNDGTASREQEQLTVTGRMAALASAMDVPGELLLGPQQAVEQRGLAGAGRSQQDRGRRRR